MNNKGFILAIVLAMVVLVMILSTAALKMSELGYLAYGSERRYQIANTAAEHAANTGLQSVVTNQTCPGSTSGTLSSGGVNASYSYFSITGGGKCFVVGKGTFGGATVVKTVIVPASNSFGYGALTLREGGTVNVGSSSAVANCNTSCKTPGVVYGGTLTPTIQQGLFDNVDCSGYSSGNLKGVYGSPQAMQSGGGVPCDETGGSSTACVSTPLSDRVPEVFGSTDWNDLKADLGALYGVNVGLTSAGIDTGCQYAGTSSQYCQTTSSTTIGCGASLDKHGDVAATTTISLSTCSKVYIGSTPLEIKQSISNTAIVASGDVSVSSSGNLTNTKIFSNNLNIDKSAPVAGGVLYANTKMELTGSGGGTTQIGTSLNPTLFLAGNEIKISHNGGVDIYGIVFSNTKLTYDSNGGFTINGAMLANGSGTSLSGSGNALVKFDQSAINTLKTNIGGTFVNTVPCGGTSSRSSSIMSTKMTVY